jgi:hypothetical protein
MEKWLPASRNFRGRPSDQQQRAKDSGVSGASGAGKTEKKEQVIDKNPAQRSSPK